MKTIYVPFAIVFLFLINSCKKDTTTDPIPTPSRQDTLTTGWKKILVDTSEGFSDIFFNNTTTGYLTGSKTYKSTNGGLNWNVISNQSFVNLAVTNSGNAFFTSNNGLFRATGGSDIITMVKQSTASNPDIFFVNDSDGYYLGNDILFNTTDGGLNWTKLTTTGLHAPSGYFSAAFFTDKNTGWIASNDGVYKTNGSPLSWVAAAFTGTSSTPNNFTSVFTTSDNTVYTCASNGQMYKSTNGGNSFSLIHTFPQTATSFSDMHFVDNNTGYVSISNKIYKTTDAGSTWNVVVTLGNGMFVEIHFTDANHGWACGTGGTVLVYNL